MRDLGRGVGEEQTAALVPWGHADSELAFTRFHMFDDCHCKAKSHRVLWLADLEQAIFLL